jgi:cobyrinic acid a,c-diamide synthase
MPGAAGERASGNPVYQLDLWMGGETECRRLLYAIAMGAELVFFSPLADRALPDVDSLYLPGGYPELHLQPLQDKRAIKTAVQRHFQQGKKLF